MKIYIEKFIGQITPRRLFYIISAFGIIGFLIYAYFANNISTFNWLVMEHNSDWEFADYFAHVLFGKDLTATYNQYDVDPCFPPLSYLFYHYLYTINPVADALNKTDVMNYPYSFFLFLVYSIITSVLFVFAIISYTMDKKAVTIKETFTFVIIMLLSVPFMASAIERGNAIFFVCVLLIAALHLRDSDSALNRELALIFIAIAANFKLYPAIIGLLYIKEKRYKEAFRLFIYGVSLFLVPFIFFGGIKGIKDYLHIIQLLQGKSIERITTIRGVCTTIAMRFGGEELKWTGHAIGKVAENIYLVIALFAFYVSKNKWKSLLLLVSPMVVYVSSAYRYTIIYFILPLIVFFFDEKSELVKNDNVMDYVYSTFFALIFTIPVWIIPFEIETYIYIVIYIMLLVVIVDVLAGFFTKNRKRAKTVHNRNV